MKKWKCTVCGYIHEGETPPEKCPVCGADRTKFIEITEPAEDAAPGIPPKKTAAPEAPERRFARYYQIATNWMTQLHGHPISVHIPNGVLPVAVIFLFFGIFFQSEPLCLAAYYNLVFVVIAMPAVLFSGYVDWKNRYGGNMTHIFLAKMVCGGLISLIGLLLVVWELVDPHVAQSDSGNRISFLVVHLLMLGIAMLAGYLGGKLVFKD